MDFLQTANAAYSTTLATLSDRGMRPTSQHSRALHSLLGTMSYIFQGRSPKTASLSSLSPGMAKTTALVSFINHITANPGETTEDGHKFSDVGILVCINTLDEIEAFASQLDPARLCVWVGREGELEQRCAALGKITKPTDAQILVTTHRRIEIELNTADGLRDFGDASSLAFQGELRRLKVWDEVFLMGTPVVLPLKELRRAAPYLREFDAEAGNTLDFAAKIAHHLIEAGNDSVAWTFTDVWRKHKLDLEAIIEHLRRDRKITDGHLESLTDIFKAVEYISGRKVIIRSDGNAVGNSVLTYEPTIPQSFLPVVILDASGRKGIRRTYDNMVADKKLHRLEPEVPKSYKNFAIDVWHKGGGKASFISNFQHRVEGIAKWIVARVPDGERCLVIQHLPDGLSAGQQREKRKKYFRPVMPDLSAALVAYLQTHHPMFDVDRLAFTTWGQHRGQNKWSDYGAVVAAGTLFKPDSVYEATYRLSRRFKPERGLLKQHSLSDFKIGEYADDLLQGLGRIRIRKAYRGDSTVCPPAVALVVASTSSKIPEHLGQWFPEAQVRQVVLMPEADIDGTAGRVFAYLNNWHKRSAVGAFLKFRDIQAALGVSSKDFRQNVLRNKTLEAKLLEMKIVKFFKDASSKYAQGWQITSIIDSTREQLADERSSCASVYGFAA